MGDKDIAEKALEWMPDIFADIVNAYFAIQGIKRTVQPHELMDTKERSVYVSSGDLRDQERDVVKLWTTGEAVICLMGFENQTDVDPYMSFRVFGYEGGDYRYQLTQKGARYPVITIVLYLGTDERWAANKTLYERLNVPDDLKKVVNDCRVNVFELAWLSGLEEQLFKSDFKHVVHYLRQVRIGKERKMLPDPLVHAPELLTLLKALAKDDRYDEFIRQAKIKQERGEIMTFPSLIGDIEDAEKRGEQRGEQHGTQQANEATAIRMLKAGKLAMEEIANYTALSLSAVQNLAKAVSLGTM